MARLDEAGRKSLLRRARTAIARAIGAERVTSAFAPDEPIATADKPDAPRAPDAPSAPIAPDFKAGAFVTLRISGTLRGCIGYPEPMLPLVEVVERCAVSAALSDPRFPPLTVEEWIGVDLEISVLGPLVPVGDISEVEIGRHGLIVERGRKRGLLLPQVAVEWNWSAAEFALQTCVKAGLPRDAWQNGAILYKFEADVFGESG